MTQLKVLETKAREDAPNLRIVAPRDRVKCGSCTFYRPGTSWCTLYKFFPVPIEVCDAWLGARSGKAKKVDVRYVGKITKIQEDQRLVFGWMYVTRKADGVRVVDYSLEIVQPETLEKAAYGFVLHSRKQGEMHQKIGVGRLVECVVFTAEKRAAMGIPDGILPDGIWVGFYVDDDNVWKKIKDGTYCMFSFGGKAIRRVIDAKDAANFA